MKKKILVWALAVSMVLESSAVVYGTEFTSGIQEEALEIQGGSERNSELILNPGTEEEQMQEAVFFADVQEEGSGIAGTDPDEMESDTQDEATELPDTDIADADMSTDVTDPEGNMTDPVTDPEEEAMDAEPADTEIFTAGEEQVPAMAEGEVFCTADFRCELKNSEVSILEYIGNAEKVEVPEAIEGYAVTAISEKAFFEKGITEVKLPAGIKAIGAEAFAGCAGLTRLEIPAAVAEIGENAFASCTGLVLFCYPESYGEQYAREHEIPCELLQAEKTDITTCTVTMSASEVCTGKALTPAVEVKDGEKLLVSGTDYLVKYHDNINPGTGTAVITGMGTYEGTLEKTFKITLAVPRLASAKSASYCSVKVTWKAVPGAESYILYYKGDTIKSWKRVKTGIKATSYVHKNSKSLPIVTGKRYTYTVKAVCGKITSSYEKAGKSAVPSLGTVKLGNVKSAAYNKLKISWTRVAGASGYYIYRKTGNSWRRIGSAKASSSSYIHTGNSKYPIKTGTTYTYSVKAYRKTGKTVVLSGGSRTGIKGKTVPDKPVLISAECTDQGKITIRWKKASGATNYLIYRKNAKGHWQQVANVKGGSMVGYTHVSSKKFPIVTGKTYTYTVRSYTTNGKTKGGYDAKGKTVKAVTAAAVADSQLRKKAREIINRVTTPNMTKAQKLRACWNFIMASDFHPWAYPDTSKSGWKIKCAMDILTTHAGNCYGFAHGFAALARELGYEPYVIVIPKEHCFVLINGGYWDNMGNKMGVASRPMGYTASQITKF